VQALNQTADAQFKQIAPNVSQLQGHVVSQENLGTVSNATMGKGFGSAVAMQGGSLTNTATATGEVQGSVSPSAFQTLKGVNPISPLQQDRNGLPPLTAVSLSFDQNDLKSTWQNHTEKFTVSYGQWRTSADGERAALTLSRDVYDGQTKLGTEQIPLVNGDAYFSTSDIARTAPVAKYMVAVGTSYDVRTGQPRLSGLFGKQLTPQSGILTGCVNNGWAVMYTYRFGGL
jgi:hypothetical protein